MNKKYCSIREFCKETGLSQYLVRTMVAEKQLPGIYSGKAYLVNYDLAIEYLNSISRGETANGKLC